MLFLHVKSGITLIYSSCSASKVLLHILCCLTVNCIIFVQLVTSSWFLLGPGMSGKCDSHVAVATQSGSQSTRKFPAA